MTMRLLPAALPLIAVPLLAACTTAGDHAGHAAASAPAVIATGTLHKADGTALGTARLTGTADDKTLLIEVSGMAPGTYGTHIHAVGLCEGPAFASAGAHWNPTAHQHGRLNPQGTHSGDLPNLVVGADGRGTVRYAVPGALTGDTGLFDADGASVVIHAGPDDERTDPSGNSGARVACAVLTR